MNAKVVRGFIAARRAAGNDEEMLAVIAGLEKDWANVMGTLIKLSWTFASFFYRDDEANRKVLRYGVDVSDQIKANQLAKFRYSGMA